MTTDLISLVIIALVAACCPIFAKLIPGKLVHETVFLLIAGALLGPHMFGAIELTESVGLLSDLGLAFLFLLAIAITLITTAPGTLMPILKEGKLIGTPVSESIISYGTWGEVCPVLAMALLLSTRAEWKTILILLAFVGISILVDAVGYDRMVIEKLYPEQGGEAGYFVSTAFSPSSRARNTIGTTALRSVASNPSRIHSRTFY